MPKGGLSAGYLHSNRLRAFNRGFEQNCTDRKTSGEYLLSMSKTDEQVPRSGTYRVSHAHVIRDIRLLKGKIFPACPKCSSSMEFLLISAIPVESAAERFRFLMQGPVLYASPQP
jgi:hypothetical protein